MAGFLPVGHTPTQSEIDQNAITISRHRRTEEALTIGDLHRVVRKWYNCSQQCRHRSRCQNGRRIVNKADVPTDRGPSFLQFAPDFDESLPEQLSTPADVDDVTRRIEYEDAIIESSAKLRALVELRNGKYRTWLVSFYWNPESIV